jgi:predicted TIM-barrel fold metal-dependent hydrolase
MTEMERMMAEFAAKGGQVKKVADGEGLNLTTREWKAKRGWEAEKVAVDRPSVTVVVDHCGREFYKNEAGEWL